MNTRPDRVTELNLIRRISTGDRDAETELFERFQLVGRIEEMVYCRTRLPAEEQRDIIADALLAIVINLRADHPSGLGGGDLSRHVASVVGQILQWQGRPKVEESASIPTTRKIWLLHLISAYGGTF